MCTCPYIYSKVNITCEIHCASYCIPTPLSLCQIVFKELISRIYKQKYHRKNIILAAYFKLISSSVIHKSLRQAQNFITQIFLMNRQILSVIEKENGASQESIYSCSSSRILFLHFEHRKRLHFSALRTVPILATLTKETEDFRFPHTDDCGSSC